MIIDNARIEHLNSIESIAREAKFIAVNTRMIYYLCCSIFSKYSFVAIRQNEQNDKTVVGYLCSFPDSEFKFLWIHQLVVSQNKQNIRAAGSMFGQLVNILKKEGKIKSIRFAIRKDNPASYVLATKPSRNSFLGTNYNCKSLGVQKELSNDYEMDIFEVELFL